MDITTQAVANTAKIHLKNAKGEHLFDNGKPVAIVVYGPSSKEFSAVDNRQSVRALKRLKDNDGQATPATPEERAIEEAEDLAALTVGFENLSYPPAGDKQGSELFEALYSDPSLGFIRRQVARFVSDWANFLPGSATN